MERATHFRRTRRGRASFCFSLEFSPWDTGLGSRRLLGLWPFAFASPRSWFPPFLLIPTAKALLRRFFSQSCSLRMAPTTGYTERAQSGEGICPSPLPTIAGSRNLTFEPKAWASTREKYISCFKEV